MLCAGSGVGGAASGTVGVVGGALPKSAAAIRGRASFTIPVFVEVLRHVPTVRCLRTKIHSSFFLFRRSHSISFTRAQGIVWVGRGEWMGELGKD